MCEILKTVSLISNSLICIDFNCAHTAIKKDAFFVIFFIHRRIFMAILKKFNKERYTVIDMNIVRDKRLSLKDLGLLVQLLALPDNWQFSEKGLEKIFERDGKTSIRTAIKNLEDFHYLKRTQLHDSNGKFVGVEWCIFEIPYEENLSEEISYKPFSENRISEKRISENQPQYNINKVNKQLVNIQSQSHSQCEIKNQADIDIDHETKIKDTKKCVKECQSLTQNKYKQNNPKSNTYESNLNKIKEIFQQNIDYKSLLLKFPYQKQLIDELLYCMIDVYLNNNDVIKINGEEKNINLVKSVYMKINSTDIEHIISQYEKIRHKIVHVNAYLKTMLFTCKQEIGHFYTNAVRVDGIV